MANAQEIEEVEIETTEDKAKAIGKEIGVTDDELKDKEDDAPDYDIQEEPDERIAKEKEPRAEKPDRKITNKEKRDARKKRISEKFHEKDSIIAAQQEELNQLKQWREEVNNKLSGINKAEVDKAFDANVTAFNQAEKEHAEAFSEGDGTKATKAMRVMYEAQRNIDRLQEIKQQVGNTTQKQTAYRPSNAPDPVVVNKAKSWTERNAWYKNDGTDTDSEIAKAISAVLANEGYDPKSDDFWDELDDRLAEKKIGSVEDDAPSLKSLRKRASPPIGSGANRGDVAGRKTITLPTSYINMLKANKIIAERERILRESGH